MPSASDAESRSAPNADIAAEENNDVDFLMSVDKSALQCKTYSFRLKSDMSSPAPTGSIFAGSGSCSVGGGRSVFLWVQRVSPNVNTILAGC